MTQAQVSAEPKTGRFRRFGDAVKSAFGKLLEKPPRVEVVFLTSVRGKWDGNGTHGFARVERNKANVLSLFSVQLESVDAKTGKVTIHISALDTLFNSFSCTVTPGELFTFKTGSAVFTAQVSMDNPALTRVHPMLETIGFPGNNSEKPPEVQAVGLNYRFGVWDGKGNSNYVRVFKESGSSLTLFLAKFNGVDPNTGKVAIEIHGIEYNILPGELFTFTFSVIRNQKCTGIVSLG